MKKTVFNLLQVFLLSLVAASCSAEVSAGKPYEEVPQSCKVEAFVSSTCKHCKNMEAYLKAKNIPYTRRDVVTDYWARQDYLSYDGTGVPLVKIGKKIIRGYQPEAVDEAFRGYCKIQQH